VRRLIAAIIVSILSVILVMVGLAHGRAGHALAASRAGRTGEVVTATVGPDGGVLTLTDGITPVVVIEVPPLAVTAPVTLALERTFPPDHSPTPPWIAYSFVSFYLDAYRDGRLLAGFAFSRPVTVTTAIADYYAGENWHLFYWDEEAGRWEKAVGTCTPAGSARRDGPWLHTTQCRASAEFAVLAAPFATYLPSVRRELPPLERLDVPAGKGYGMWVNSRFPEGTSEAEVEDLWARIVNGQCRVGEEIGDGRYQCYMSYLECCILPSAHTYGVQARYSWLWNGEGEVIVGRSALEFDTSTLAGAAVEDAALVLEVYDGWYPVTLTVHAGTWPAGRIEEDFRGVWLGWEPEVLATAVLTGEGTYTLTLPASAVAKGGTTRLLLRVSDDGGLPPVYTTRRANFYDTWLSPARPRLVVRYR
jgi:hypothetical protein